MTLKTIDFRAYSSIKIGQPTAVHVIEHDEEALEDGFVIGGAYNLLVSPSPKKLLMLGSAYDYIVQEENVLRVGAATMGGRLMSYAKKHGLAGFEFLTHIPGTIGGMLAMNAGVKEYEIFGSIQAVKFANGYKNRAEIKYGYRHADLDGIALEAVFELKHGYDDGIIEKLKSMRENQPKDPSAGSAFKNPEGDYAGRLVEAIGLKGIREGGMSFSEKHANFLVNLGDGGFEDAMRLIEMAKKRVFEEHGKILELEIKIV
jgi:UDP-N-acetylmuramate dehydrogenase